MPQNNKELKNLIDEKVEKKCKEIKEGYGDKN